MPNTLKTFTRIIKIDVTQKRAMMVKEDTIRDWVIKRYRTENYEILTEYRKMWSNIHNVIIRVKKESNRPSVYYLLKKAKKFGLIKNERSIHKVKLEKNKELNVDTNRWLAISMNMQEEYYLTIFNKYLPKFMSRHFPHLIWDNGFKRNY